MFNSLVRDAKALGSLTGLTDGSSPKKSGSPTLTILTKAEQLNCNFFSLISLWKDRYFFDQKTILFENC